MDLLDARWIDRFKLELSYRIGTCLDELGLELDQEMYESLLDEICQVTLQVISDLEEERLTEDEEDDIDDTNDS